MLKRITVLAPSLVITYIFVIAAALDKIAEAFPEISESVVQLLTSLPSLMAIPIVFVSGALSSRFTKKTIVIGSLSIMIVGGLIPLVFHTRFWMLMFGAVVIGIGYGGISPLTSALIVDHFEGDEQAKLLGFQATVIGIGGIVFSALAGKLSMNEWWHVYFAYVLLIPVLILAFFLPRGELMHQDGKSSYSKLTNKNMLITAAQGLLFSVFFFTFQNNVAMLVSRLSIGGEGLASKALSIHSVTSIVSGLVGGRILNKLRQKSLAAFMLISGIGLIIVFIEPCVVTIYVGAIASGFVHSMRMSAGYLKAKASVTPQEATMAISAYCGISQAGQFLSPLIINPISDILSSGIEKRFLVGGTMLLIVGVISFLIKDADAGQG